MKTQILFFIVFLQFSCKQNKEIDSKNNEVIEIKAKVQAWIKDNCIDSLSYKSVDWQNFHQSDSITYISHIFQLRSAENEIKTDTFYFIFNNELSLLQVSKKNNYFSSDRIELSDWEIAFGVNYDNFQLSKEEKRILRSYYGLKGIFVSKYSKNSELITQDCLGKIIESLNSFLWKYNEPHSIIDLGIKFEPLNISGDPNIINKNGVYFTLFMRDISENGDTTRRYETYFYSDYVEGLIPCYHIRDDELMLDTVYTIVPNYDIFSQSCITRFIPENYKPGVFQKIDKKDILNKDY